MKKDLTGLVFGKLTVNQIHSKNRNGHIRWECLCECKKTHNVLSTHLIRGLITHCGCSKLVGRNSKLWTGYGDISGNTWYSIKRGSDGSKGRLPIEFSISIEYAWELFEKQGQKCALSNLPIWFTSVDTPRNSKTASLDRIDSSLGYIPGNVQWVHKDINKMKNSFDQQYFINLCKLIGTGGTCELI
jgi:hypothetical protein